MAVMADDLMPARLVPELLISDIKVSLKFWCDTLGFSVMFDRPEKNFSYLNYKGAELMLDQRSGTWETGVMEAPFGRGINLQIETDEIADIKKRLSAISWPIYEERKVWYRTGDVEAECSELLVQDPDGYLLRFSMITDQRPLTAGNK